MGGVPGAAAGGAVPASATAHAVAAAWILASLATGSGEVQLVIGMFLTSVPGQSRRGAGVGLALWLALLVGLKSPSPDFVRSAWGPVLLFMSGLREPSPSAETSGGQARSSALKPTLEDSDALAQPSAEADFQAAADVFATSQKLADGDTPFEPVLEAHVPRLPLGSLVDELLDDTWRDDSLLIALYKEQGATEICISPWSRKDDHDEPGSEGQQGRSTTRLRHVVMQHPIPWSPMGSGVAHMRNTVRLSVSWSGDEVCSITVEPLCSTHGIPFSDNFVVQERIQFLPSPTVQGIHVVKSFRCIFFAGPGVMGSAIRSLTSGVQGKTGDLLLSLLQQRASVHSPPSASEGDPDGEAGGKQATCFIQVWELERRATLFHTDWHEPFLPHDGQKKWRWVDASYQCHPWLSGDLQQDATSTGEPPIWPPEGWEARGTWSICSTGDSHGWQYAIDFYLDDWWWNPVLGGHHVRRRLWEREFVQRSDSQPAPPTTASTAPGLPGLRRPSSTGNLKAFGEQGESLFKGSPLPGHRRGRASSVGADKRVRARR